MRSSSCSWLAKLARRLILRPIPTANPSTMPSPYSHKLTPYSHKLTTFIPNKMAHRMVTKALNSNAIPKLKRARPFGRIPRPIQYAGGLAELAISATSYARNATGNNHVRIALVGNPAL